MQDYNNHILLLTDYVGSLGYKVIESDCDSWDYNTKTICNNKNRTQENRVIYLSHEAGHAEVYDEIGDEYFTIFPGLIKEGKKYKDVSMVEWEVLAWDKGLKRTKQLNIPINLEKYAKIKISCIRSYL